METQIRASVAVIGGGVIGASVAYHLAKNGVRDVVILDRASQPGKGSTGKATGGYRAQFETAINVRLSLFSRDRLLDFLDETGVDSGYAPVGYLWLACNDSHLEMLRDWAIVQQNEGLTEVEELSTEDIAAVNPMVSTSGVVGAAFCRSDGYIKPLEILRGYLEAGARFGVTTMWSTACVGFAMDNRRITRVRTSSGDIDVDTVVNAAGAWAADVGSLAGVDVPVTARRIQAAYTHPTTVIPPDMPLTIYLDTGFHLRSRDGRALLCLPTMSDESRSEDADDDWIATVVDMTSQRVPALRDVPIDREKCYAGLYEMSPDQHAIVGYAAECENMFLVNGSSGHGVMHSPALGSIAADMICGNTPALDLHALRPSRFAERDPIVTSELL